MRYGPRVVDLDIALYGDHTIDLSCTPVGPLIVPHKLMRERTFVLAPLADIAPGRTHPALGGRSLSDEYRRLCRVEAAAAMADGREAPRQPTRVLPIREDATWELGSRTYVMGVINVTPDSFSDGGRVEGARAVVEAARAMAVAGANMLDLGAESTRPGAARVDEDEEMRRLLPAITAIRSCGEEWARQAVISADTSRSSVAAAALDAGADIINDISGGTFDPAMLRVAASRGAPLVLMHTVARGGVKPPLRLTACHMPCTLALAPAQLTRSWYGVIVCAARASVRDDGEGELRGPA